MVFVTLISVTVFISCIKDRSLDDSIYTQAGLQLSGTRTLLHYWNFNDVNLLAPAFTIGGSQLNYTGTFDAVTPGTSLNARNSESAGNAVRLRNPAGIFSMNLPTTNYSNLLLSFAVQRTTNGARQNLVSYSVDGVNFTTDSLRSYIHTVDTGWLGFSYDFSHISGVNNNPNFKIQIRFAINDTGSSGNNRFDNITLEGDIINPVIQTPEIIHYWNFNNASTLFTPTSTIGGGQLNYSAVYDSYTPGSTANARNGDPAGDAARLRNISASNLGYGSLLITAPTTGFKNIKCSLEVQGSSNGPQTNSLTYSTDGTNFISTGISNNSYPTGIGTAYNLVQFDFSNIPHVNNNPNFKIRIELSDGSTTSTGNDRFDNIVLEGVHQ